jgi:uncharacterized membrane protein YidH (DUF202 family)
VRRAGGVAVLWGAMLLVLAVVLWAVFVETDYLSVLLPAFAVGGTVAIAALAWWRAGRRTPSAILAGEPSPDSSWSSVLVAVAVALIVLGLEVGTFLCFVGGGLAVLGIGGLLREWRAERRAS